MWIFIEDLDYELWKIISKGSFVQIVKEGGKIIAELLSDSSEEQIEKVAKNYTALNIVFCGLNSNEFNRVSSCDISKVV